MDERQQQIRERAGLEESRLNQDFIDFLTKWGTPLLAIVAVVAGSTWGYNRLKKSQNQKLDQAFIELVNVGEVDDPSPESLKRVADEFGSQGGVGVLARMEAADALMRAVRRGVRPGAEIKPDGALAKPEDALTDAEKKDFLDQAAALYAKVAEDCRGVPERKPLLLGALFGSAATAEGKLELDAAKSTYEEIIRLTEGTDWSSTAAVAKNRIAGLEGLKTLPKLYTRAEIPKLEEEVPVTPPPAPEMQPGPPAPTPEVTTPLAPVPAPPAPTDNPPAAPK